MPFDHLDGALCPCDWQDSYIQGDVGFAGRKVGSERVGGGGVSGLALAPAGRATVEKLSTQ